MILLLLILWPIAEVFVAIQIAQAIGVLPMLLLLIAGWPLGIWALRSQGRVAWRRLSEAVGAGRPPAQEVLNGALVLLGGVLMIIPGFITDALGLLLLAPPTRSLARRSVVRNLHRHAVVRAARFGGRRFGGRGYDVDSTATDVDAPQLRP